MVDCGRYPVKRVVGEPCVVEADIFRDGDHVLHAVIKWRPASETQFSESPMMHVDNDRWRGEFPLDRNDRYFFTIEAWTDLFASWERGFRKKAEAGRDVASDLLEGIAFIESAASRAQDADRTAIDAALERLRALGEPRDAVAIVSDQQLLDLMARLGDALERDRVSAVTGGDRRPAAGALRRLVRDVPALARRHPRARRDAAGGRTPAARNPRPRLRRRLSSAHPSDRPYASQGPNNSLTPLPDSPGSPWAIGSEAGGHTAVEPALGSLDDFDHFVWPPGASGLEVALDFAIQCSPDHPWAREHPEWFRHRPDGSIKYAENPPKEYQDIYPIDFEAPAAGALMEALQGSGAVLDRPRRADLPGRQSAHQAGSVLATGLSQTCRSAIRK